MISFSTDDSFSRDGGGGIPEPSSFFAKWKTRRSITASRHSSRVVNKTFPVARYVEAFHPSNITVESWHETEKADAIRYINVYIPRFIIYYSL